MSISERKQASRQTLGKIDWCLVVKLAPSFFVVVVVVVVVVAGYMT